MRVSHVLIALMVAVSATLAGNLIVAPYGPAGYESLGNHGLRLESNLQDLEDRQRELRGEIELLTRSSDAVRTEARSLGYYGEGESVFRIEGSSLTGSAQSPGTVIRGLPVHADRRGLVRLVALVSFVVTLVVLLILDRETSRSRHGSMARHSK